MTKRYLKVEVCKELHSEVYLAVDDADPRFAEIFTMTLVDPKTQAAKFMAKMKQAHWHRLNQAVHVAAEQEAEDLDSLDWGDEVITADWYASEVKPEDAEQYGVVDLTQIASEQHHHGGHGGEVCDSIVTSGNDS